MAHRLPTSKTSPDSQTLHVSDYLRVIHKRRWTAVIGILLVFVTGAFRSLRTTPIYQASSQIQIEEGVRSGTLSGVVESQQQNYYEDDFYLTQHRILQSRALALRVIEQLHVSRGVGSPIAPPAPGWFDKTKIWIGDHLGVVRAIEPPPADETTAQSQAVDAFLDGLRIEPVRNTRLVDIRYRSADPVFASRAANAVAEQYKKQNTESRFIASKETNTWLDNQLEAQRKIVQASDQKLQQYKEEHGVVAADDRQNTMIQNLGDLSAELTRAKMATFNKEAEYKALQSLESAKADVDAYPPSLMANDSFQKLKTELAERERERLKLANAGFLDISKEMQAKDREIQQAKSKLSGAVTQAIEGVRSEYEAAKSKQAAIQGTLDEQKRDAQTMGRLGIDYAALDREAASNRQLYENLLQMAKETGVTTQYKGSNISIIDAAELPRAPILPNTKRDITMAFLGGCLLGLGLVFGFEYMDSRIKTPDDIKTHLGLAFLGIVPVVPTKEGESILLDGPVPAAFSEAMRAIRTSVIFSSADEGSRTIVVTSTAPSEGKTSVATNLACALAQTEQRTLIIDGDMRRPRVHEVFGRPQEPGLSNVLVGTTPVRDAIRTSNIPHLSVMPAGHLPPNPAELLGSNRYIELMDELQRQFDWIVVDAPPVMAVTDAAVIAHTATGVMFVVGAEMTPRRNAVAAVEQLVAARAKFLGAVLNKVNVQKHSYYYSPYYRKDYSRAYERAGR